MDMANMLDSGQNSPNTTFPNMFSLISADPVDLSHIGKNHFCEKIPYFGSKMCSRRTKTGSIRKPE